MLALGAICSIRQDAERIRRWTLLVQSCKFELTAFDLVGWKLAQLVPSGGNWVGDFAWIGGMRAKSA